MMTAPQWPVHWPGYHDQGFDRAAGDHSLQAEGQGMVGGGSAAPSHENLNSMLGVSFPSHSMTMTTDMTFDIDPSMSAAANSHSQQVLSNEPGAYNMSNSTQGRVAPTAKPPASAPAVMSSQEMAPPLATPSWNEYSVAAADHSAGWLDVAPGQQSQYFSSTQSLPVYANNRTILPPSPTQMAADWAGSTDTRSMSTSSLSTNLDSNLDASRRSSLMESISPTSGYPAHRGSVLAGNVTASPAPLSVAIPGGSRYGDFVANSHRPSAPAQSQTWQGFEDQSVQMDNMGAPTSASSTAFTSWSSNARASTTSLRSTASSSAAGASSQDDTRCHGLPPPRPWRFVNPNSSFGSANQRAFSMSASPFQTKNASLRRSSEALSDYDEVEDDVEAATISAWGLDARAREKASRRQGVTCDQCRDKHLRCDLAECMMDSANAARDAEFGIGPSSMRNIGQPQCSRCYEKGLRCTKTNAPPSRRYPRPSRTGKRIEQARLMHGSVSGQATQPTSVASEVGLYSGLGSLLRGEGRLGGNIMARAVSVKLLTSYFAAAHCQMPIIDFDSFTTRYNLARGDARTMSIMLTGGNAAENIPSIPLTMPGLSFPICPATGESTMSTPGTSETLMAVMHAWGAHFTDMPIVFGSKARELGLGGNGRPTSGSGMESDDHELGSENQPDYSHLPPSKRPKRKQGVACDTCRLRRVRCDLMERNDGMPCSRCQDKKIVCTDEYIQLKRKRNEAKMRKEREKQRKSIGGTPIGISETASLPQGDQDRPKSADSEYHQSGDHFEHFSLGEILSTPQCFANSPRHRSLLPFGLARRPFCHELLTRAVVLVHKHQLLYKPSVEGVQALCLLVQLFHIVDPGFAAEMMAAAASHMGLLGIQTPTEVDETDPTAVEALFHTMQSSRVYLGAWTSDAFASCMLRKIPNFEEEKAISISASKKMGAATEIGADGAPHEGTELTPAMGLSFAVMAQMQIGVLARFVTKHIDGIEGPTLAPSQERFPLLPTEGDNRKVAKACQVVWKSNEALTAFFDRCVRKSWSQMENMKHMRPTSWLISVKATSTALNLMVYRILGERHKLNAAYLHAISQAHGPQVISAEDLAQSQTLRELFEYACQKTLASCRKLVRLLSKLLQNPGLTFQTGSYALRQLTGVAVFLARMPVEGAGLQSQHLAQQQSAFGDISADLASWVGPPNDNNMKPSPPTHLLSLSKQERGHIDPRSLGTMSSNPSLSEEYTDRPTPSEHIYNLATDYDAPLQPFDAETRHREISVVLEAVSQLAFAWPWEEEIDLIKAALRGDTVPQ